MMALLRVLMVEPGMTVVLLQAVSAISDRLIKASCFFMSVSLSILSSGSSENFQTTFFVGYLTLSVGCLMCLLPNQIANIVFGIKAGGGFEQQGAQGLLV